MRYLVFKAENISRRVLFIAEEMEIIKEIIG